MNEQLQQALTDLINKSLSGIDATKDFLVAELPDVIQQLLLWYGVYNFILFCWGITLVLVTTFGAYKYLKWLKNKFEGDLFNKESHFWVSSLSIAANIFIFIIGIRNINIIWLKIWIAPKIWLIEYAGSLIK